MRDRFIAGNWKMYKTPSEALKFAEEFKKIYKSRENVRVVFAVPYPDLAIMVDAFKGTGISVAAQNMHFADEGAFTGEVSPLMLKDLGAEYVIVGHSERREFFGETDEIINKKLEAALVHGINPILCVGESLSDREEGRAKEIVKAQLISDLAGLAAAALKGKLTVAYEPIWAIGTGKTAKAEDAEEMCLFIREVIKDAFGNDFADALIIQYGGSVKPDNATELFACPNIDGALVGGASLEAVDFAQIIG